MARFPASLGRLLTGTGKTLPRTRPMSEMGVAGFAVYGGYLVPRERRRELIGEEKYRTYADIVTNISIAAASVRLFLNLLSRPNWSVEPVEDIGDDGVSDASKEVAELVEAAMHSMDTSWTRLVRRLGLYRFHGFTVQEWTARRDEVTGRILYRDIEARPQNTILRWEIGERGEVLGMWQTSPQTGQELFLPREKVIYIVDDTLTDDPEGIGLYRHMAPAAAALKRYLQIEGVGFDRDLRGTPVGRAPLTAIRRAVSNGEITEKDAESLLNDMNRIVQVEATKPNTGIVLDSQPHEGQTADGAQPTGPPQWGLELVTGSPTSLTDIGTAINRLTHDIARIVGTESILLGGSSAGSYALSKEKSSQLYQVINSTLGDIAEALERDFITPLWSLNGLPEELRPTLKHEDVSHKDVAEVTAALRDMAAAGAVLRPDDPAVDDVRDLLGISRQPELPIQEFGPVEPNSMSPLSEEQLNELLQGGSRV